MFIKCHINVTNTPLPLREPSMTPSDAETNFKLIIIIYFNISLLHISLLHFIRTYDSSKLCYFHLHLHDVHYKCSIHT